MGSKEEEDYKFLDRVCMWLMWFCLLCVFVYHLWIFVFLELSFGLLSLVACELWSQ